MSGRFLLLGGTGFIGQALAKELIERDAECEVCLVGRSMVGVGAGLASNPRVAVREEEIGPQTDFLSMMEPGDTVVHLFSSSVPVDSGADCYAELQDIPVTARLLEACSTVGVSKFLFVSSAGSVYGNTGEGAADERASCEPISLYAYQKLAIEELVRFYGRTKGLKYCIARLSNPYGPGQDPARRQGVVAVFLAKAIEGSSLVVRGGGDALRDYIFIEDAARAIAMLASCETKHNVYNVGAGSSLSLMEVVHAIEASIGKEVDVRHVAAFDADVGVLRLDVSRYEAEFGTLALTPFSVGVDLTRGYLLEQMELESRSC